LTYRLGPLAVLEFASRRVDRGRGLNQPPEPV